tara:strand:- start:51 stop:995 length:945 start_codon:yes stop_codon:yes gene_type:complete
MSKRILISGLGGSLFPYLNSKLKEKKHKIYYLDSNSELKFIYPNVKLQLSPIVTSNRYFDFVLDIIKKNKIEIYIPLIDEELLVAKSLGEILPSLKVLIPNKHFIELCLNKYLLMQELDKLGISKTPSYLDSNFKWQIQPPLFVKPNSGRGSRGIRKIENQLQLEAYKQENSLNGDILIQPLIEGIEYTVGVLTNNKNEILSISPKKVIKKDKVTVNAVTENNPIINKLARKIIKLLKPKGPFNIQLFLTKEMVPIIFEINPRFSTTLILSMEAGVDEIDLLIDNYNSQDIELTHAKEGVYLYRTWKNTFYEKN